jgi:malonyl-CoA/methylmalonyl-CoA synthetase
MQGNLFTLLRSRFPADLGTTFIEEEDGSTLSYGELVERTGRIANALRRLGVRPGDRVAMQVEKSAWALLVYLGTLRAGAVHLPLNPAYTIREVGYFLGDAEPALFVCRPGEADAMQALVADTASMRVETLGPGGEGTFTGAIGTESPSFEDAVVDPDDLAAILYTSGTTGRSKGAMLSHGNLASNAETLREVWRFTRKDRLLHALPIFHTHGLFVATNTALLAGASMIFLPRFEADAVIRLLPRATVMMGVPTFYTRLLARFDFRAETTAGLRLFVSGSAPLSAETHREFQARTGHAILERYGMTETNMNTSNPYDGPRVPGSVGPPLPGVELRITDPQSAQPVAQGEIGMIEVRGPNVFKGYWRMAEKTAEEMREDGFFITGDLGHIDAQGYVHIVGRSKDLVITGGLNVYPAEVEAALEELEGVGECAVVGVPHHDFGEAVIALVTGKSGHALSEQALKAKLAGSLSSFKQPKRVFIVDELPRNAMGKVQKNVLRERYEALFSGS